MAAPDSISVDWPAGAFSTTSSIHFSFDPQSSTSSTISASETTPPSTLEAISTTSSIPTLTTSHPQTVLSAQVSATLWSSQPPATLSLFSNIGSQITISRPTRTYTSVSSFRTPVTRPSLSIGPPSSSIPTITSTSTASTTTPVSSPTNRHPSIPATLTWTLVSASLTILLTALILFTLLSFRRRKRTTRSKTGHLHKSSIRLLPKEPHSLQAAFENLPPTSGHQNLTTTTNTNTNTQTAPRPFSALTRFTANLGRPIPAPPSPLPTTKATKTLETTDSTATTLPNPPLTPRNPPAARPFRLPIASSVYSLTPSPPQTPSAVLVASAPIPPPGQRRWYDSVVGRASAVWQASSAWRKDGDGGGRASTVSSMSEEEGVVEWYLDQRDSFVSSMRAERGGGFREVEWERWI